MSSPPPPLRKLSAASSGEPSRWLLLLAAAVVCFNSVTLATGAAINGTIASVEAKDEILEVSLPKEVDQVSPRNEPACLQAGGICVANGTCPAGFEANITSAFYLDGDELGPSERLITPDEELCPNQAGEGVKCCYQVSISEKRCSAFGGECRTQEACGRAPRQLRARCPTEGTVCCILVF